MVEILGKIHRTQEFKSETEKVPQGTSYQENTSSSENSKRP